MHESWQKKEKKRDRSWIILKISMESFYVLLFRSYGPKGFINSHMVTINLFAGPWLYSPANVIFESPLLNKTQTGIFRATQENPWRTN